MVDWSSNEFQLEVPTNYTEEVMNPTDYTSDRGGFMDFIHDTYVGMTEAVDLVGGGLETAGLDNPLRGWSDKMSSLDLYKPDAATYYGEDSWGKRLFSGITQNLPTTLAPIAAGIGAGVIGSAVGTPATGAVTGGIAGISTMLTMFGGGTYAKAIDEGAEQGMSGEKLKDFAMRQAASELLTETLGTGVALATGGAGKLLQKPVGNVIKGIWKGTVSPEAVIKEVAGVQGVTKTLAKLLGGASVEGGTEVVNSLYQNYNRANSGLEVPEEDLAMTFAIGMGLGGTISGGANLISSSKNRQMRRDLSAGLQNKEASVRLSTFDAIGQRIVDPEMKAQWEAYRAQVEESPLAPSAFKNPEELAKRKQENIEKVIGNPQDILKQYGVEAPTFGEIKTMRERDGQDFTTNLNTTPLDSFISEAVMNDPQWVTAAEGNLRTDVQEPTNLRETVEQRKRLNATATAEVQGGETQVQQDPSTSIPAGTVQESVERQDDQIRDLPPQTQMKIRGQEDLSGIQGRMDAMAEGPTTKVTSDPSVSVVNEPVAARAELKERAEWTKGRVGKIKESDWSKLSPERAAQFREILEDVPYEEAYVRERTDRGIFVPMEEIQKYPEVLDGQEAVKIPTKKPEEVTITEPQEAFVTPEEPTVEPEVEEGISLTSKSGTDKGRDRSLNFSDGTRVTQIGRKGNFKVDLPDGRVALVNKVGRDGSAVLEVLNDEKKLNQAVDIASERLDSDGNLKVGRKTEETKQTETIAKTEKVDVGETLNDFIQDKGYMGLANRVGGTEALSKVSMRILSDETVTPDNVEEKFVEYSKKELARTQAKEQTAKSGVSTEDLKVEPTEGIAEGTEVQKATEGRLVNWPRTMGAIGMSNDGRYRIKTEKNEGSPDTYQVQEKVGMAFRNRGIPQDTLEDAKEAVEGIESLKRKGMENESLDDLDIPDDFFEEESGIEETTIGKILKDPRFTKRNKATATFLERIIPMKKMGIKVIIDPNARSSNYSSVTDTITLTSTRPDTAFHEIVHAVTVKELLNNESAMNEVKDLLSTVRKAVVDQGLFTESEINAIVEAQNSQQFKELFPAGDFGDVRPVAYALQDPFEFLAQAFKSRKFQEVLSKIEVPQEKTTLWDKLVDWLMGIWGVKPIQKSALKSVLKKIAEVSQLEPSDQAFEQVSDAMEEKYTREKIKRPSDYNKEVQDSKDEVPLDTLGRIRHAVGEGLSKAKTTAKDLFQPVSDAILAIDEGIARRLDAMDAQSILNYKRYSNEIQPFLREWEQLTEDQKRHASLALYNSDFKEAEKFMSADTLEKVKAVLNELDDRAREAGMQYSKKRKMYFPRRVKDLMTYMDYLKTEPEGAYFQEAFRAKGRSLGKEELTDSDKMQTISDILLSGRITTLPRPGATKERTVPWVNGKTLKFYGDAGEALVGHIFDMNEKVAFREFAGATERKQLMGKANRIIREIESGEMTSELKAAKVIELEALEDLINNEEKMLEASVAGLIEKTNLSTEQERELVDLLKARMRPRGAWGFVDDVRNVGYITSLGNFMSAITQLADIPIGLWANYDSTQGLKSMFATASGLKEALKTVGRIVSNDINQKTGLTPAFATGDSFIESMDFTNALKEFSSGSYTSKLLDTMFKLSGLKYTDLIGKETFMQASFSKLQNMTEDQFKAKYGPMFEERLDEAWSNRSDKSAESTKMIVFAELARWQPVSMSQQSKTYITSGNGRIFYMLKTFQLRATNAALREGLRQYDASNKTAGDKAKMLGTMGAILGIYAMAGASVDELKDLIKGKESNLDDSIYENIMGMFLISQFDAEMGLDRDQLITKIVQGNLPPLRWLDQIGGDLYSIVSEDKEMKYKTLNLIPLIGNLVYGYSGAGRDSEMSWRKRQLSEEIRDAYESGDSLVDFNSRIFEYNEWARSTGENEINLFNIISRGL